MAPASLAAICGGPMRSTRPVSYTHLDVYKRQGVGQLSHRALPASADGDEEAFQETLQAFKSYYARHNNDTTCLLYTSRCV